MQEQLNTLKAFLIVSLIVLVIATVSEIYTYSRRDLRRRNNQSTIIDADLFSTKHIFNLEVHYIKDSPPVKTS
jgi:hypothetical protein